MSITSFTIRPVSRTLADHELLKLSLDMRSPYETMAFDASVFQPPQTRLGSQGEGAVVA